MELINASHNFKPTFIQQFKANQDENVSVDLYLPKSSLVFTYPLKDFRLFFTDSNIEAAVTDNDEELIFMTADKTLKMVGIDYKWAIEPVRGKKYGRLIRLLSENVDTIAVEKPVKSKTKTSSTKMYYVEIATCENDVISDIKPFSGNRILKQRVFAFSIAVVFHKRSCFQNFDERRFN